MRGQGTVTGPAQQLRTKATCTFPMRRKLTHQMACAGFDLETNGHQDATSGIHQLHTAHYDEGSPDVSRSSGREPGPRPH